MKDDSWGLFCGLFGIGAVIGSLLWALINADMSRGVSPKVRAEGIHAAQHEIPPEACPYSAGVNRQEWMNGWIEGRLSKGYPVVVEK